MTGRGFLLGSSAGVLTALVLIVALGVSGAGHHIDLIPSVSETVQPGSSPSVVAGASSTVQAGSLSATSAKSSTSAPTGVSSVIERTFPLVVAVALGAAFYGFYNRRLDAE